MSASISVVIPAYNVGPFIATAIESAVRQVSTHVVEILVVDDGSTDDTAAVVRSTADRLGDSGRRVQLLTSEQNYGSARTRNRGIHAAKGDYVAFLDGDDFWLDHHCATVAGLLDRHPDAVLAYSSTQAFGDDDWVWPIEIPADLATDCFWPCFERTIVPQMNAVVRRQALLDLGGYRTDLRQSQDFDLFLRLSFGRKFVCTHDVTSRYRRHENSITRQSPEGSLAGMYAARHHFWVENADHMSADDRDRFRREFLEMWVAEVEHFHQLNRREMVDFYLSLHRLVPGSESEFGRLNWRRQMRSLRRMEFLRPVWNTLPTSVREAFRRTIRPAA